MAAAISCGIFAACWEQVVAMGAADWLKLLSLLLQCLVPSLFLVYECKIKRIFFDPIIR